MSFNPFNSVVRQIGRVFKGFCSDFRTEGTDYHSPITKVRGTSTVLSRRRPDQTGLTFLLAQVLRQGSGKNLDAFPGVTQKSLVPEVVHLKRDDLARRAYVL
jgi:hypothetical protein